MRVFKENAGDLFNIISIHTEKGAKKPMVNGVEVNGDEAMRVISSLDKNGGDILKRYGVKPDIMTVVFQVDMLSEGINVKSFNSVIVTTSMLRRAMQQFGRVFRNYDIEGFSKRENGHASVYVV